jgi:hypothetical protein
MAATKKTESAQSAHIVKRIPRPAKDIGPVQDAGVYRVIHGTICIARPKSEYTNPDGTENPFEPKWVEAGIVQLTPERLDPNGKVVAKATYAGDEIWLDSENATRLMELDLIEKLDTKPSRVGRVFDARALHATPRAA